MTWPIRQHLLHEGLPEGLGHVRHVSLVHVEVTFACDPGVLQGLGRAEPLKYSREGGVVMKVEGQMKEESNIISPFVFALSLLRSP